MLGGHPRDYNKLREDYGHARSCLWSEDLPNRARFDAKLDAMLATEAAIKLDDAARMAALDQDE